MGKVRDVLFSDANEVMDRWARWYITLPSPYRIVMTVINLLLGVAAIVLWSREGLDDVVAFMLITVAVVAFAAVFLGLPYVALRAVVRRIRRS